MARSSFWILLTAGLLVATFLLLPRFLGPPRLGQALGWIVVLYHVVLVGGAWLRGHHEVLDAWLFLAPLSLFQVVPDWLLAQQFGVLVFPLLGGERLGPVPAYVAGNWVAPLLVVVWLAELVHRRFGAALAAVTAAASAGAVFAAIEWLAPTLSLWHARNVATVHGVALYALAAEVVLGVVAWLAFVQVQARALPLKVLAAFAVSACYTGAAVGFLFVASRIA